MVVTTVPGKSVDMGSALLIRFGLVAGNPGGAAWTDTARRVERLGFSTVLVPDTLHTPSPLIACAVAAAGTSTLRTGPYVLSVANRPPGQVAYDVATLSQLTGGRFELGVGAGRPGAQDDAAAFGMPYGSPRERIAQVEATVAAVRTAAPEVPVLIAGSGPRMLRIGGRLADTVALDHEVDRPNPIPEPLPAQTPQERDILDLIARGDTNRQIGQATFLSEKTVKNYVSNILARLGLERRTQAAVLASQLTRQDT